MFQGLGGVGGAWQNRCWLRPTALASSSLRIAVLEDSSFTELTCSLEKGPTVAVWDLVFLLFWPTEVELESHFPIGWVAAGTGNQEHGPRGPSCRGEQRGWAVVFTLASSLRH